MDFLAHLWTLIIYLWFLMYSWTQYLHNLATTDTNRLFTYILDFSGFRLHSDICMSLQLCRINTSFRHLFSLLTRSLILGPQDLIATDIKPCLAHYTIALARIL